MSQYFGSDSLDTAKKCFTENTRQYVNANAHVNPEAYNLYHGLFHLVKAVEEIRNRVDVLEVNVNRILQHLG
jgi:Zn-dependent peptidase ImmA (M78 family)